jgi:phosphatidylserine/phosphatidylglycerophosphate/cardiolipin synthase-like enzyme
MTLKARSSALLRCACAALLLSAPAWAEGQTRLVQSIPKETALAHPDLAFAKDAWIDMIHGAKHRLDFGEFYIATEPGGALEPVLTELEQAAQRGVKIRFVLSNRMLDQDPKALARLKAIKGLDLRIFDLKGVSRGIIHAKYFLVDGKEAFIGSQNFDWRALEHIHELGIRSTDPRIVDRLQAVFEVDWRFALDQHVPAPSAVPVLVKDFPDTELVASPAILAPGQVRPAITALVQLIAQAHKHIQVQLLTYSPVSGKGEYWPVIDNALRDASVRGVQVELMISDWVLKSRGLAHLKALSMLPGITVRIVSIPEASTGHIPFSRTIHSKYMVVDDSILWVGTSNWEQDYFMSSRNVEVILRQQPLATQGGEIFKRLWTSPYAAPLEPMKTYVPRKVD